MFTPALLYISFSMSNNVTFQVPSSRVFNQWYICYASIIYNKEISQANRIEWSWLIIFLPATKEVIGRQVGYCVLLRQQRIHHPSQSKNLLVKMLHLCLCGAIAHGMQPNLRQYQRTQACAWSSSENAAKIFVYKQKGRKWMDMS